MHQILFLQGWSCESWLLIVFTNSGVSLCYFGLFYFSHFSLFSKLCENPSLSKNHKRVTFNNSKCIRNNTIWFSLIGRHFFKLRNFYRPENCICYWEVAFYLCQEFVQRNSIVYYVTMITMSKLTIAIG